MTDESKHYEVHLNDYVGVADDLQVSVKLTAEGVVTPRAYRQPRPTNNQDLHNHGLGAG
jgi:hypothetical protein